MVAGKERIAQLQKQVEDQERLVEALTEQLENEERSLTALKDKLAQATGIPSPIIKPGLSVDNLEHRELGN